MLYEVEYSTKYPEPTLQKGWAYGSKEYDIVSRKAEVREDGSVSPKQVYVRNFWLICNPEKFHDKNSNIRFHGNIKRLVGDMDLTGESMTVRAFEKKYKIEVAKLIEEWQEDLII